MKNQNENKTKIRDFIIETLKKTNVETTGKLIQLVTQEFSVPESEVANIVMELEAEKKISISKKIRPNPTTLREHAFSQSLAWFWLTAAMAFATTFAVFLIAEEAYPLAYVRQVLGSVFVLFLPGFALTKALFPSGGASEHSSENLGIAERVAISIGVSIALTAMVGLILNYTPWGVRLFPITLSLLSLTLVLATVAALREQYHR
jgi:hypothetical protein